MASYPSHHDKLYQEYLNMTNSGILGGSVGAAGGLAGLPWPPSTGQANYPWGLQPAYSKHAPDNMRAALAIRMGWNVNQTGMKWFEHCEPRKLNDEKAVVFVIHAGKAMAIEDDLNLFPSDTLITQLRILQDT